MFHIAKDCLKIENKSQQILSLGGDDNCRGDGVRNRLSVLFEDATDRTKEIVPDWLTEDEKAELIMNRSLTVWSMPERFESLLRRHLEY